MGEKTSVEEELWRVFTYYSLRGDPSEPETIGSSQFVKFGRDALIVKRPKTSAAATSAEERVKRQARKIVLAQIERRHPNYMRNMMSAAQAHVIFTSIVRSGVGSKKARINKEKMTFTQFLSALMKMSVEVYGTDADVSSPEEAFQQLLMENVLCPGLAERRTPKLDDLKRAVEESEVQSLLEKYEEATKQIFRFYATAKYQKTKDILAEHRRDSHIGEKDFDAMRLEHTKAVAGWRDREWRRNPKLQALGYNDFFKFASDFDLVTNLQLSSMEIGAIYLAAVDSAAKSGGYVRSLTHREFQGALVHLSIAAYEKRIQSFVTLDAKTNEMRAALRAYDAHAISTVDKIRGLFMSMWKAVHDEKNISRAALAKHGVKRHAMDIFRVSSKFIAQFNQEWQSEGYRDYSSPRTTMTTRRVRSPAAVKSWQERGRQEEDNDDVVDGRASEDNEDIPLDPSAIASIRGYLDERPGLKGLLKEAKGATNDDGSPMLTETSFRFKDNRSSPSRDENGVGLGEYERAMAALRLEMPDSAIFRD